MARTWSRIGRTLGRLVVRQGPRLLRQAPGVLRQLQSHTLASGTGRPVTSRSRPSAERARAVSYSPDLDGRADPGEIVWTWVTYEEDASRGKDRPVLVVGRDGSTVLGLMLSSQSSRDGQRDWMALVRVRGTRSTGRVGCAWTGCSTCRRTASAGRARCSAAPGSPPSPPGCAPSTAGAEQAWS